MNELTVQVRAPTCRSALKISSLRNVTESDYDELLRLNRDAVPHVNLIDAKELEQLRAEAIYCKLVENDGEIGAFLIALPEGQTYQSLNYQWFSRTYDRFVYIDRIITAPSNRRRGFGAALYADLINEVTGKTPRLTCEVNLEPPNPGSLTFHGSLGFVEVDQQLTEGGKKRVSLMAKELS